MAYYASHSKGASMPNPYAARSRAEVAADLAARKGGPPKYDDSKLRVDNPNTSGRLYRTAVYDALAIRSKAQAESAKLRDEQRCDSSFNWSIRNNNEVIYGKDQPAAFH